MDYSSWRNRLPFLALRLAMMWGSGTGHGDCLALLLHDRVCMNDEVEWLQEMTLISL